MYWWHLVNKDEDSMLHKFYKAQQNNAVKGDWVNSLLKDKQEFNIDVDDETLKIKFKTKQSFKTFLKRKSMEIAVKYLSKLKNKHSKLDDIHFSELKCAKYLEDSRISQKEAKLLFKLRTRMYNVKSNFKEQFNFNLACELCSSAICDQRHLLQCKVLQNLVPELKSTSVRYNHLFGSMEKILPAIKLFTKITENRDEAIQILQQVRSIQ